MEEDVLQFELQSHKEMVSVGTEATFSWRWGETGHRFFSAVGTGNG